MSSKKSNTSVYIFVAVVLIFCVSSVSLIVGRNKTPEQSGSQSSSQRVQFELQDHGHRTNKRHSKIHVIYPDQTERTLKDINLFDLEKNNSWDNYTMKINNKLQQMNQTDQLQIRQDAKSAFVGEIKSQDNSGGTDKSTRKKRT